jgi:LysM repeat protein
MKILKIFGVVVGIHLFALILIFANPGCSSTTKAKPTAADTAPKSADTPKIVVPSAAAAPAPAPEPVAAAPAPAGFNPDAPAALGTDAAPSVRFVPTRPGTPVAGTLVTEPVADVTPATTYAVKSGDSLWTIAKKNNLTVAQLAAANGLAPAAALRPGQKLILPSKGLPASAGAAPAPAGAAPAPAPAKASATPAAAGGNAAPKGSADSVRHTVKPGESLGVIARNYGVRQGDIAVANNISDPAKIRAGMELIIPGWQSSAGKSAKGGKAAPAAKPTETAAPAPTVAEPAPAPAPVVPVIRIDDSPITPAPKP